MQKSNLHMKMEEYSLLEHDMNQDIRDSKKMIQY